MVPSALEGRIGSYLKALEANLGSHLSALYLVGGLALGDFSERFSNVDLVVVTDGPLEAAALERLRRGERVLAHAKRDAGVWYTTWAEIADEDATRAQGGLDTPLTRALLRDEAVPVVGPDWPVVAYREADLRSWCSSEFAGLVAGASGKSMVMRTEVTPFVLQAARLAVGVLEGNVVSKSEAAAAAGRLVPHHFRRILADSSGFRKGASTSMYWGPFERKYDVRELIKHLQGAVGA